MQQRSSSSASRSSGERERRAINVADAEQPQPMRRKNDDDDLEDLPLYDPRSTNGKREIFRSRSMRKWIHAIPVIVLLCLFILWWFSSPVNLIIKGGRITAIRPIHTPLPNNTRFDLTILAVAATPIPSIPQNVSSGNKTYLLMSTPN